MPNNPIYLDYHSTTPQDPRVTEKVLYYMHTAFGNASSTDHEHGLEAEQAIKQAKKQIASLINASSTEIIFTSGTTESINLVAIMAANNEIGTIYPVQEIAKICQRYSVPYFCDASQAAGKIPLILSFHIPILQ